MPAFSFRIFAFAGPRACGSRASARRAPACRACGSRAFGALAGGALALVAALAPLSAGGQTLLRPDSARCQEGLSALGALSGADLRASGLRSIAGRCVATGVRAALPGGGALALARLEWDRGAVAALADGALPPEIALSFRGASLSLPASATARSTSAAPRPPAPAGFTRAASVGGGSVGMRDVSGRLRLVHDGESRRLRLEEGSLRFAGGATLALTADLSGASPLLATRPAIGALGLSLHRLEITLSAPPGAPHPLLEALLAGGGANNPARGQGALKGAAGDFLRTRLGPVLGAGGLARAEAFLKDAPRPAHPLHLALRSEAGLALPRLLAFRGDGTGGEILAGATLEIAYGP